MDLVSYEFLLIFCFRAARVNSKNYNHSNYNDNNDNNNNNNNWDVPNPLLKPQHLGPFVEVSPHLEVFLGQQEYRKNPSILFEGFFTGIPHGDAG